MELLNDLNWRYATKRMNGEKVSDEKMNIILESIRLSASSLGIQPYRVFVIENPALRAEIYEKACQQPQIVEGSHIIVFASFKEVNGNHVDEYLGRIAQERNMTPEQLAPFKGMIDGFLATHTPQVVSEWAARQTYIALGTGLVAAAAEKVDSTPMEGFNPAELDKILGLAEKNLRSVSILALGYRDENTDYLSKAKKIRLSKDEFFTML